MISGISIICWDYSSTIFWDKFVKLNVTSLREVPYFKFLRANATHEPEEHYVEIKPLVTILTTELPILSVT